MHHGSKQMDLRKRKSIQWFRPNVDMLADRNDLDYNYGQLIEMGRIQRECCNENMGLLMFW